MFLNILLSFYTTYLGEAVSLALAIVKSNYHSILKNIPTESNVQPRFNYLCKNKQLHLSQYVNLLLSLISSQIIYIAYIHICIPIYTHILYSKIVFKIKFFTIYYQLPFGLP